MCPSGWGAPFPTSLRYHSVRYPFLLWIVYHPELWPAVNIAFSLLLGRGSGAGRASATRASWAVALLTFAAVVIRMEIAGLLGLFTIQLLLDGTLSITRLIKVGVISGLGSIGTRSDLRQFTLHSYTSVL